ncbi:DUF4118 domain-containing protein [Streptomyces inhibens]|uniref:DUF4118 domain-containing protein n=1 Tax=Streptomyces inhibens TaxID=2293571 RepID=UPI00368ACB2A
MAGLHHLDHLVPSHRPRIPHVPRTPGIPRALRALALLRPRLAHRAPPNRTLAGDLALPLGAVGAALLVTALLLTGERAHTTFVLAVFTLLTLGVAALTRPVLVPVVALVSWMFYDGFVLNRSSELAFQPQDRTSLLVLLLAGLAGAGCAAAVRAVRRHSAV